MEIYTVLERIASGTCLLPHRLQLCSVVGRFLQTYLTGDQSQVRLSAADRNLEIHEIPNYHYQQSEDIATVHDSNHV